MTVVSDYTAIASTNWMSVWDGSKALSSTSPTLLTYSFPTKPAVGLTTRFSAEAVATFSPLNDSEKDAARLAFDAWASASGLTLIEVSEDRGDIRVSAIDTKLTPWGAFWGLGFGAGSSYFKGSDNNNYPVSEEYNLKLTGKWADLQGEVYFDRGLTPQKYIAYTMLHEIGHALNMKHPFETHESNQNLLDSRIDNTDYTIMSYTRVDPANKLGKLDISAAQVLYGPPDSDGKQFSSWSFDKATESFFLKGFATADFLRGTSANDVISGGAGDDVIYASGGNDQVIGGAGLDRVSGGFGVDTYVVDTNAAPLVVGNFGQINIRVAEGWEYTIDFERFQFKDKLVAYDVDGNAGQAYRLYQAAFARVPDTDGLSYWVGQIDRGMNLRDAANGFIGSAEFKSLYSGAGTDLAIVSKFYQNVLGRPGEASGVEHWTKALAQGTTLAEVLVGFSESPENVSKLAPLLGQGITLDMSLGWIGL